MRTAQSLQSRTTRSSVIVIYLDPRSVPTHNGRNADEPLGMRIRDRTTHGRKAVWFTIHCFCYNVPVLLPPVPRIPCTRSVVVLTGDWKSRVESIIDSARWRGKREGYRSRQANAGFRELLRDDEAGFFTKSITRNSIPVVLRSAYTATPLCNNRTETVVLCLSLVFTPKLRIFFNVN